MDGTIVLKLQESTVRHYSFFFFPSIFEALRTGEFAY